MPNSPLEQHLSLLSFWVNVASAIVAVGICGEYLLALSEGKKDGPKWKRRAKLGLAVLIVIGLVLESWIGRKQTRVAEEIQTESDKKVVATAAIAGAATQRAAEAEKETAELRKQAEDERLAMVKLEKSLWPPFLDVARLSEKLKVFSPQWLDIIANNDSENVQDLAVLVEITAQRAGWHVRDMTLAPLRIGNLKGINDIPTSLILTARGADKKTVEAAKVIVAAFRENDLDCIYADTVPFDSKWPAINQFKGIPVPAKLEHVTIEIMVGTR